tara:strand:+ start:5332 stop:6132 length:801 start_codon:yes stop_codon:yes gene_type:complete
MAGGSGFGRITAWDDFTSLIPLTAADTVPLSNGVNLGDWAVHAVNEGTMTATVDEPGGVLALVTDTGDNDNAFVSAGTWSPADGTMVMEGRIKIPTSVAATRAAAWIGFTETLSVATPVMPFETATTTTTYNGSGGMVGFGFDSDATSILWRFAAGDGGAALATEDSGGTAGGAIGIDAQASITADRWWVFRVMIHPNGLAEGWIMDRAGSSNSNTDMRLVGKSTAALGTGDQFHAMAGLENRSAANEEFELDYMYASGFRDWAAN